MEKTTKRGKKKVTCNVITDETHGKLKTKRKDKTKLLENSENEKKTIEKKEEIKTQKEEISKVEVKEFKKGTLDKYGIQIIEHAMDEEKNVMKEMPNQGTLKIFSWNINGIRALKDKGILELLIKNENPDIICFNETKIDADKLIQEKIHLLHSENYGSYWNCCKIKRGYSGVGILTKFKPLSVFYDIGIPEHDLEGRVLTLEYPEFYIVSVYVPNAGEGIHRLNYRVNDWDKSFQSFLRNLAAKKNLILCGDMNVAHNEIDVYAPKRMEGGACFTKEERESFGNFLASGFIDTFRHFNPGKVKYSFFTFRGGQKALDMNNGWRLDYFIVNKDSLWKVEETDILIEYKGSDHRPIKLVYRLGDKKEQ